MQKISRTLNWIPPVDWLEIKTIDAHTGGEPLRIIVDGFPNIIGRTILEKRSFLMKNLDHIRKALMLEPRGHNDMYGAIITEPDNDDSDIGVIFLHNDGYSTGCGHAVIAITKVLVETGVFKKIEPETTIKMDVPSGRIISHAKIDNNKVTSVRFINVPSFVQKLDAEITLSNYGTIKYDLAFGGAFYAIVSSDELGLKCDQKNVKNIIDLGMKIKLAIANKTDVKHPIEPKLNFLYGTIFTSSSRNNNHHSKNVCVFANGEIDRSPTGTGVSARAAVHYARKEIGINDCITIESIIGSTFQVKVVEQTSFGAYNAIIPEVSGSAYITGKSSFWIDPDDVHGKGFMLG